MPFDAGEGGRPGARLGPLGMRQESLALRPLYNPAQRVQVFEWVSAVDQGDSPVQPGCAAPSLEMMTATLGYVHEAEVVAIGLGGDHSAMMAGLRAAAEHHGPLALLQFDAHANTWDEYLGGRYTHGTVVRRAVDEGLVDPRRSTLMGMRGGLNGPHDYDEAREMGFTMVPWDDLAQLGTGVVSAAVEAAGGKAFLAFDIDFVDPAFAPGTDLLEVGGPTSAQALALLRACRGLSIAAAGVLEVAPELDATRRTGTLGAVAAYEILSLVACERRDAE